MKRLLEYEEWLESTDYSNLNESVVIGSSMVMLALILSVLGFIKFTNKKIYSIMVLAMPHEIQEKLILLSKQDSDLKQALDVYKKKWFGFFTGSLKRLLKKDEFKMDTNYISHLYYNKADDDTRKAIDKFQDAIVKDAFDEIEAKDLVKDGRIITFPVSKYDSKELNYKNIKYTKRLLK